MKLNKTTYFSVFFLFCFLASFSVNTFHSLKSGCTGTELIKKSTISFSKKDQGNDARIDLLLEENENETEDGFNLPAFVLPFSTSLCHVRGVLQKPVSTHSLAETWANPIYIAVCNFRI